VGDTDALVVGHPFMNMPSIVALGIVEMQMQLATDDIHKLLSILVSQL
jgi:hypothetical protein